MVSNRVDSSLSPLERMLREALRGTLPVYRTTPISALHREITILPIKIILNQKRASARLRVSRLDNRHPYTGIKAGAGSSGLPNTTSLSTGAVHV